MKKVLLILLALVLMILIAGGIYAQVFLPQELRRFIEKVGSESPGRSLRLAGLKYSVFSPLEISLEGVTFEDAELRLKANVPTVRLNVDSLFKTVNLEVDGPKVVLQMAATIPPLNQPPAVHAKPAIPAFPVIRPFAFNFKLKSGSIQVISAAEQWEWEAHGLEMDLKFDQLSAPWTLGVIADSTFIKAGRSIPLPLELKLKLQDLAKQKVRVEDGKFTLSGIPLVFQGSLDPATNRSDVKLFAKIEDLSKLAAITPKAAGVPSKLLGSLEIAINAENPDGQAWKAQGRLVAKGVRGTVALPFPGGRIEGPIALDADSDFIWNGRLTVPHFNFDAELSDALLEIKDKLAKPPKTRLSIKVESSSDGKTLDIREMRLNLAQLGVLAKGKVASEAGQASSLAIDIPNTSLAGLEKIVLPLANTPLTGSVEASIKIDGDLSKPETLHIAAHPLLLNEVRGGLDWTSSEGSTSLRGPLSVSAKVELVTDGPNVRSAAVNALGDLTALEIKQAGVFHKKAGQLFDFKMVAAQNGNKIDVKSSQIRLLSSTLMLSGSMSQPQRPNLSLKLNLSKIRFEELASLSPVVAEFKFKGEASADATLTGIYDFKEGLPGSPLNLAGSVRMAIPEVVWPSASATAPVKSGTPSPTPLGPLLPDWPILRNANLKTQLSFQSVRYGTLNVIGVTASGALVRGDLSGKIGIAKIFGGSVQVPSFEISLVQVSPDVKASASFNGIEIKQVTTWLSPEWKDVIDGSATGTIGLLVPDRSRADFLDRLQAAGKLKLAKAYLSTLQVQDMINQKLAQIPLIADKAHITTKAVSGDLVTQYKYTHSKLELDPFNFIGSDRDEVQLKGWVTLDQKVDLVGTAFLVNSPVKGPVQKANSDSQGRLMVPIEIKGNLMSPSLGIAEATIQKMAERTAQNEIKERTETLKNQVQDKAKNAVQDQIKKGLNGLLGH